MNQGYPPPGAPPPGAPFQGYPAPPPPPAKKGMSGCLIAVLVAGGFVIVIGLVVGIFAWKATERIGELAKEGLNAPGAAELRAAGCDAAAILDMSKLSSIFDAGSATAPESVIVSCNVAASSTTPPTCDALAKVYVKAVGDGKGTFLVQVLKQGSSAPTCKRVYGPNGAYLRDSR